MINLNKYYLVLAVIIFVLIVPWFAQTFPVKMSSILSIIENAGMQLANVLLARNPKTIEGLKIRYAGASISEYDISPDSRRLADGSYMKYKTALDLEKETKVKILLVPGHEPDFGGTEYGALLEREMNVRIANMLKEKLESDEHFQVFITRDNDAWNSDFDNYFKNSWEDIKVWQKANKENIKKLISLGSTSTVDAFTPKVTHNKAPDNVALRLYGITKWANENDIDIVIHIHFNDYPRYNVYLPGVYKGFSIYVPIGQYDNSTTTNAIAKSVLKRLSTKYHISTYEAESAGIIDSPDLIAIGANNTSDAASLLIEYGYIYEKQFSTRDSRTKVFEDMASLTYLGLLDFFTGDTSVAPGYL